MKRQRRSSLPSSSSSIFDDIEPIPKRPRIVISSTRTSSISNDEIQLDEDEEIIVDGPQIPSVIITEDSQTPYDDEIIEIEDQDSSLESPTDDYGIIFVSDSENDESDDQGIDVTDDILRPISSTVHSYFSPSYIDDLQITLADSQDVLAVMDDEIMQETISSESPEMITQDSSDTNDELIDLTDEEPARMSNSSIAPERKLSVDVQQCPICLETLSDLQRTGVYLIITRCHHVMCILCSRQLLALSPRCPLCRENVSSTNLMPYCILT